MGTSRLISFIIFAVIFVVLTSSTASADIKTKTRTRVGGQTMEGTVYIKGARQRSSQNFGGAIEMVTLMQCDLKRSVQINDRSRSYMVISTSTDSATPADGPRRQASQNQPAQTRRGGIITYTSVITDTGERRKMFGFTARHIKTSMTAESTPDACSKTNMRIETDGWYIDLDPSFSCDSDNQQVATGGSPARPECRDEIRFKRTGSARLGYALLLTTTMHSDGGQTFVTTTEVVELETTTLDAALFEVPAGYTEAKSYQELMGIPSIGPNRPSAQPAPQQPVPGAQNTQKQPGKIRVGVVIVGDKTGKGASSTTVHNRLIGGINDSNIEAVPLEAGTLELIQPEARKKGCDYILFTDITQLKKSGKVGGVLGRVSGMGRGREKVEAKLEFKLYSIDSTTPQLASSAASEQEGSEESTLSAVAEREARAVVAELLKGK